jgi:hypothetical protein
VEKDEVGLSLQCNQLLFVRLFPRKWRIFFTCIGE